MGSARGPALAFALAAAFAPAALPHPQDGFDPSEAWPDFREIEDSIPRMQQRAWFEFDRFERYLGRPLDADAIAGLRARWEQARTRGLELVEKYGEDPYENAVLACNGAIEVEIRKYYPEKRFLRSRSADQRDPTLFHDVELFFEMPPDVETTVMQELEAQYRGALSDFVRWFDAEYARPLGLQRQRDARPFLALIFLADRGQYEHLWLDKHGYNPSSARAHYSPALRLAFSYERVEGESDDEKLEAVLHELTHAMLDSLRAPRRIDLPLWLNEGMAEYCSEFRRGDGAFQFGQRPRSRMHDVARWFADDDARAIMAFSLEELTTVFSYPHAASIVADKARARGFPWQPAAVHGFYGQSKTLVWYLEHGDYGRHREAFRAYLERELAGEAEFGELAQALAAESGGEFEAEFRETIVELATVFRSEDLARARAARDTQAAAASPAAPIRWAEGSVDLAAPRGPDGDAAEVAARAAIEELAAREECSAAEFEEAAAAHGSTRAFRENRDALRAICGRRLDAEYRRGGLCAMPIGTTRHALDDGRVEVAWEFDDAAELADFAVQGAGKVEDSTPPAVADGALNLSAPCRVEAAFGWQGDVDLELEFEPTAPFAFEVTLGDAVSGERLAVDPAQYAWLRDALSHDLLRPLASGEAAAGARRILRVSQADGRIEVRLDDGRPTTLRGALGESGRLVLEARDEAAAGALRVHRLVLRAAPDAAWLDGIRPAIVSRVVERAIP